MINVGIQFKRRKEYVKDAANDHKVDNNNNNNNNAKTKSKRRERERKGPHGQK